MIKQQITSLTSEYNTFETLHPGFKDKYSKTEFFETWTIMKAKTKDIELLLPGFTQKALAPFIDQINFSVQGNIDWKYERREGGKMGYWIEAKKPIKRGEELVTEYPTMHNKELMSNYGFVDPENENPIAVVMGLNLGPNDPLK